MASIKYQENEEIKDIVVKIGDTLPTGTEVDYNGDAVPTGWEEIGDTVQATIGTTNPNNDRVWFKQSKNLLPNNLSNTTINGLTLTKNSDGSITISGTATAQTQFYFIGGDNDIYGNLNELETGKTYIYSCCPNNNNKYKAYATVKHSNSQISYNEDSGSGVSFTIQSGDTYRIFLRIVNGADLTTPVTFYPQIELGSTKTIYEEYITPSINVDDREMYSTKNKTNCVKIWEGTAYQVNDTMLLSEPLEVGKMYIFKFLGNSSYYHNYDYFIYQNDAYSNTNTAQINYYSYPDTVGFRYRLSYQTSLQTLIINEASNGATNRAIKAIFKVN